MKTAPVEAAQGGTKQNLQTACITERSLTQPTYSVNITNIEETLRDLAPDAEIYFERIAVTAEQINDWDLPSRPTKTSDTRSVKWRGGDSVELDAIHP